MKTIKPYQTTLCDSNAYWMARIAGAAYIKRPDDSPDETMILDNLKQEDPKFLSVFGVNKNSAQGAFIEHEDYYCLAFRGTDEIADWLDNLNVFSEKVLFGEFHRGFWNSVNDVWDPLFSRYTELRRDKKKPLFITGHSLGGAMATIAAARLAHQDLPFISVYTFGQPRAMNLDTSRVFNAYVGSRFFRFQNNNDMVTRVPARLMGYSHVGSFLYISEEKKLHDDPGYWFRFLDSVDGAVEAVREIKIDAVEDHGIHHYLEAIKGWNCDF